MRNIIGSEWSIAIESIKMQKSHRNIVFYVIDMLKDMEVRVSFLILG